MNHGRYGIHGQRAKIPEGISFRVFGVFCGFRVFRGSSVCRQEIGSAPCH